MVCTLFSMGKNDDITGLSLLQVGGKKGNRTEPTEYTGRSLRKFPIVAVPGFTSVTEPNQQMRY